MMISETLAVAAKLGVDLAALLRGTVRRRRQQRYVAGAEAVDHRRRRRRVARSPFRTGAKDIRAYTRMAEDAGVATPVAQAINQSVPDGWSTRAMPTAMMPVLPGILAEMNGAAIRPLNR